jgi:hypothetical protein
MPAAGFLAEWRLLAEALRAAFGKNAEVFLVTTPEKFSLQQSVRSIAELLKSAPEVAVQNVVLNRVISGQPSCSICTAKSTRSKVARRFLRREFPQTRLLIGEDPGSPIAGLEGLARFGEHVFEGKKLRIASAPHKIALIRFKPAHWPTLTVPLSFVLGKGGVGKTTISAGLAFHTRRRGPAFVDICSVDPPPHSTKFLGREWVTRSSRYWGIPSFEPVNWIQWRSFADGWVEFAPVLMKPPAHRWVGFTWISRSSGGFSPRCLRLCLREWTRCWPFFRSST